MPFITIMGDWGSPRAAKQSATTKKSGGNPAIATSMQNIGDIVFLSSRILRIPESKNP